MKELIPKDWFEILKEETEAPYFKKLEKFLEEEWSNGTVFPPKEEIFTALKLTPFSKVKVLILGQDPYHDDNQAHGLAFSVKESIKLPPSLRNIFKELEDDLGIPPVANGNLTTWAEQGVLLLNTALTVQPHQANSHSGQGWEIFTDSILKSVNKKEKNVIFVFWGGNAAKKIPLIDRTKHTVISSAHPSPLSAYRGFFGSKPFSKINSILETNGSKPINWRLKESEDELPLFR